MLTFLEYFHENFESTISCCYEGNFAVVSLTDVYETWLNCAVVHPGLAKVFTGNEAQIYDVKFHHELRKSKENGRFLICYHLFASGRQYFLHKQEEKECDESLELPF